MRKYESHAKYPTLIDRRTTIDCHFFGGGGWYNRVETPPLDARLSCGYSGIDATQNRARKTADDNDGNPILHPSVWWIGSHSSALWHSQRILCDGLAYLFGMANRQCV